MSPIEEIVEKIEELRGKVNKYKNELSKNELLTRYVLIDPFLRLLGWEESRTGYTRIFYPSW